MNRTPTRWAVMVPILVTLMVTGVAFAKPAGAKRRRAGSHVTALAPAPAPLPPGSAGMIVVIDPETGRIGPPSPAQLAQLLGPQNLWLNHSSEGLVQRRMPDGSTMVDLQGRYREYYLVRIRPDGGLEPSCLDETDLILKTLQTPPAPAAEDR